MVESLPSPAKMVRPTASASAFPFGTTSVQSAGVSVPILTELAAVEMRVRRMFHHW